MNNIFVRRYFYPLISSSEPYNKLESSAPQNLQIANKVSEEDFWQKVIKYILSNAADKYKLLKDFFKK